MRSNIIKELVIFTGVIWFLSIFVMPVRTENFYLYLSPDFLFIVLFVYLVIKMFLKGFSNL